MKTVFKQLVNLTLALTIGSTALVPSLAYAETVKNNNPRASEKPQPANLKSTTGDKSCTSINQFGPKVTAGIVKDESKRDKDRSGKDQKIATDRGSRDEKLTANRAKWDANRAEHFAKLEAKATTDAQKQAVVTFKETVTAAVSARRAAVDAAISDFRQGANAAIAAHRNDHNGDTATFIAAVNAAIIKAQASCAAGASAKTVRTTLQSDIRAARDSLKASKKDETKLGQQIKVLAQAKHVAIKQAVDTFTATVEAARDQLKAAFSS